MLQRALDLLKGSFWKLDLSRIVLSQLELDFLRIFFDISFDNGIDEWTFEEKTFLILRKKPKYLSIN